MAPFEALYRRRYHTPLFWDEVGELQVEGPRLIQQMNNVVELIRQRIKASQDRQGSYANTHLRPLHFETGENVFLRVSPFRKIGDVAYCLAFEPYLSDIHDVFHVSLLRQYVADESNILHPTEVQLEHNLFYVERPLSILDRKEKVLRNKHIPLVMVQWQRRGTKEATWELESQIRDERLEFF
ncbi:uncharacterized protein [Henckelia pumila]|uniref:uncharacterized protein n=1 Tax=Henckelia pumila TaxID=405737 RepID=UPI003C6E4AAD